MQLEGVLQRYADSALLLQDPASHRPHLCACLMLLAYFCCPAAHHRLGSITGRAAPPMEKALNVFNALGSIAFGKHRPCYNSTMTGCTALLVYVPRLAC